MIGGACPSVTGSIVGMKCVVGYIGDWVQRAGTGGGGGRRRRDFTYNAIKRESVCEKTFIGTIILLSKLFVDDCFVGFVS